MKVVIIGNGISGVTTARYLRKTDAHAQITLVSNESEHFYARTALMYLYMGHLRFEDTKPYQDWFWAKNRIDLVRGWVHTLDTETQKLHLDGDRVLHYDRLVLALGSKPNKFGWAGQDLQGVQGLYGLRDLEQMEAHTRQSRHAVVVGGGLIGIEMVEMLHSRHIPTTFLVREASYMNQVLPPEESEMVNRVIRANGIDLRLSAELQAIDGDAQGRVKAVHLKDGSVLPTDFVGLAVGVSPNIGFLSNTKLETNRGILVNGDFETNLPNIYAVGDCAEFRHPQANQRPIEQLWYTGKMHGEVLGQRLGGHRVVYQKGIFFNSAKFFDLEYQVYGHVSSRLAEGEDSLYWEAPSGRMSIRIQFERETERVLGFNVMGTRFRQAVCQTWIQQEERLPKVLSELHQAHFDPEFSRKHTAALLEAYHAKFGIALTSIKKRWFLVY